MGIPLITSVFLMLAAFPMCSAQENLALEKPAWQSSVYFKYSADGAVDGVRNHQLDTSGGFCAHTQQEENPWWSVDLGDTYMIHTVVIYNRDNEQRCRNCRERLQGFQIFVHDCPTCDKHLCFQDSSAILPLVIYVTCDSPVTGRYLNISLPHKGFLTLCEVEVYGDALLKTSNSIMSVAITDIISTEALPSHISGEVTVNTAGYSTATPGVDGCSDSRVLGSSQQVQPTSVTEILDAGKPLVILMSDVLLPSPATVQPLSSSIDLDSSIRLESNWNKIKSSYHVKPTSVTEVLDAGKPLVTLMTDVLLHSPATILPFSSSIDLDSSIRLESNWSNTDACYCPCFSNDAKEGFMASIIQNLEIDTKNVSKRRRRYISAPDDRLSSQTMGYLGIAVVVLAFGPFVLTDAVNMVCYLWEKSSNRVKPE